MNIYIYTHIKLYVILSCVCQQLRLRWFSFYLSSPRCQITHIWGNISIRTTRSISQEVVAVIGRAITKDPRVKDAAERAQQYGARQLGFSQKIVCHWMLVAMCHEPCEYSLGSGIQQFFSGTSWLRIKGPDDPTCQLLPISSQRNVKMGWERQEREKRWWRIGVCKKNMSKGGAWKECMQ